MEKDPFTVTASYNMLRLIVRKIRYKHLMHQHNVSSPFHALFNVFNDKKSFLYHFHLDGIVQLLP